MAVKSCGLFTNLALIWNSISHAKRSKLLAISMSFKCTLNFSCNLCLHLVDHGHNKMAGTRVKQLLWKLSLLLYLSLIFHQFNYDIILYKSSSYMMLSAGFDAKSYPGHNDGLRRLHFFFTWILMFLCS